MDLGRHLVRIPQCRQRQRDETPGIGAAPVVDVPVVVTLQQRLGEVLVFDTRPQLTAEPGHRREAQRPEHAVGVHVAHAIVDVPTSVTHVVERRGVDAVLSRRAAGDRVEADVRQLVAAECPHVDAVVLRDHLRHFVGVFGRHAVGPHVGRLDGVIIDRDEDEVLELHLSP